MTRDLAVQPKMRKILRLVDMLRYRRPAGSLSERSFIKRFIIPKLAADKRSAIDDYGNIIINLGDSPVIWSCHTDSVHKNDGMQKLHIKGDDEISLQMSSGSNCLGADDAAGCWMMLEMIEAKVPGCYIFHREEEIGGKGSKFIREKFSKELKNFQYAIAFDRRGKDSIITFQGGRRCASDAFGNSLKALLPSSFKIDTGGSFTDTATYMDIVPECSNLSIGFNMEHSSVETQSIEHLLILRSHMVEFDHTKLVMKRDPSITEYKTYSGFSHGYYNSKGVWVPYSNYKRVYDYLGEGESTYPTANTTLTKLVRDYPDIAADLLEEMGIDAKAFLKKVEDAYYLSFYGA